MTRKDYIKFAKVINGLTQNNLESFTPNNLIEVSDPRRKVVELYAVIKAVNSWKIATESLRSYPLTVKTGTY
jgi:hypothetical protein